MSGETLIVFPRDGEGRWGAKAGEYLQRDYTGRNSQGGEKGRQRFRRAMVSPADFGNAQQYRLKQH